MTERLGSNKKGIHPEAAGSIGRQHRLTSLFPGSSRSRIVDRARGWLASRQQDMR